jgi:hypothetical protein
MNLILSNLVTSLILSLAPNIAKLAIEAILDVVEQAIADSDTKTDDAILIPVIRAIRETYALDQQKE